MSTVRIKNVAEVGELLVYGTSTVLDGTAVDAVPGDAIIETPGRVLGETDDAYIIGTDTDNARAWPKAHWKVTRAGSGDTETETGTSNRTGTNDANPTSATAKGKE